MRNRTLFNGPDRLAGDAIEDVGKGLLGNLGDGFDRAAVDDKVDQGWSGGNVVVPDAVVDQLVMPDAAAGAGVETDERFTEQAVARTMSAVIIAGGRFNGKVDVAKIEVRAHRCPDAGVTGVLRGILVPGPGAEFIWLGNGVEGPDALAGADVEATDIARNIFPGNRGRARLERCANHHNIFHHDGRGSGADLAIFDYRAIQTFEQIDNAICTEVPNRQTGGGVESNQMVTGSDQQDPVIALAVRPVRQTAALGQRGGAATGALIHAVHPQSFAGGRIHRDGIAAAAGGEVKHASHHDRSDFPVEFVPGAEVLRLPAPRNTEVAYVALVNLIERRVACAAGVPAPEGPFAAGRSALLSSEWGQQTGGKGEAGERIIWQPEKHG